MASLKVAGWQLNVLLAVIQAILVVLTPFHLADAKQTHPAKPTLKPRYASIMKTKMSRLLQTPTAKKSKTHYLAAYR